MPFPPTFFLIGAQKAGTTQLSHLLAAHPDICVSTPKEPHFFTSNWNRGLDWYRSCFRDERSTLIDASTSYAAADVTNRSTAAANSGVPERIYSLNSSARFIYIVRDPALRAFSAYLHNVRYHGERRSFREAVEKEWHYIALGNYYAQLAIYLSFYPMGSILLLDFAELGRHPQKVLDRCYDFIGVGPYCPPSHLLSRRRNTAYMLTGFGASLHRLLGRSNFEAIANYVQDKAPAHIANIARGLVRGVAPSISDADYDWMSKLFSGSNRCLEELFCCRFPDWGHRRS
jgi:hypothetical protein